MSHSPIRIVCFLGRGGCGKDTQVILLTDHHKHSIRISTGDLIRAAHDRHNQYHKLVEPYIKEAEHGVLIPDTVILQLVEHEIAHLILKGYKTFYLTGFPRTLDQLNLFDQWTGGLQAGLRVLHTKLETLFFELSVPESRSRDRAKNRVEEAKRKGEPIRKDDMPETVEKRLQVYREQTEPMLHQLHEEDRVICIQADRTIEAIHEDIVEILRR